MQRCARQPQSAPASVALHLGHKLFSVHVDVEDIVECIGERPRHVRCAAVPRISGIRNVMARGVIPGRVAGVRKAGREIDAEIRQGDSLVVLHLALTGRVNLLAACEARDANRKLERAFPHLKRSGAGKRSVEHERALARLHERRIRSGGVLQRTGGCGNRAVRLLESARIQSAARNLDAVARRDCAGMDGLERPSLDTRNALVSIGCVHPQNALALLRKTAGCDLSERADERNRIRIAASRKHCGNLSVVVARRRDRKPCDASVNRIELRDRRRPRTVALDLDVRSTGKHPVADGDIFGQRKRDESFSARCRDRMVEVAVMACRIENCAARICRQAHPFGVPVEEALGLVRLAPRKLVGAVQVRIRAAVEVYPCVGAGKRLVASASDDRLVLVR